MHKPVACLARSSEPLLLASFASQALSLTFSKMACYGKIAKNQLVGENGSVMRKENWEDLQVKDALMKTSMLFENQLLATKFYVPVALGPLISRPRLSTLLAESLKYPLTLVSAPAGFG